MRTSFRTLHRQPGVPVVGSIDRYRPPRPDVLVLATTDADRRAKQQAASSKRVSKQPAGSAAAMADDLGGGGGKAGVTAPSPSLGEAPLPPHIIRG